MSGMFFETRCIPVLIEKALIKIYTVDHRIMCDKGSVDEGAYMRFH